MIFHIHLGIKGQNMLKLENSMNILFGKYIKILAVRITHYLIKSLIFIKTNV